jgi:hypothetical protein
MATSPAQQTQKWVQGLGQAGPAYTAGTGAVTESPMAKAAAQATKAAANYNAAVSSGQWAASLNSVSLSSWKSSCAQGAQKLAMGAQKGQAKYQAFAQSFQPVYANMKSAAAAQSTPQAKVVASLNVIMAAGKKGKAIGMTA